MIKIKTLKTKYKILTWNIRIHKNYEKRLGDIVKFIKELNPDIALLQEVDCEFLDQTVNQFKKLAITWFCTPTPKIWKAPLPLPMIEKLLKSIAPLND